MDETAPQSSSNLPSDGSTDGVLGRRQEGAEEDVEELESRGDDSNEDLVSCSCRIWLQSAGLSGVDDHNLDIAG
jgi:hypothetical protein